METSHRIRVALISSVVILGVYIGLGVLNASFGGYDPYYSSDGRSRYRSGLLMHDCIIWQPRFGSYYNQYRHDVLGLLFYPLIRLNQQLVHPTHSVFDSDFPQWWRGVRVSDIHPDYRSDFARWQTEGALK